MTNDFCRVCLLDYDAMTSGQRSLHGCVGEMVVSPCDPTLVCSDAVDDAGASLGHTDELNLVGMRDAALLYCAACEAGTIVADAGVVESLVDVLDDETVASDDPDADLVVTARLLALVGVSSATD